MLDIPAENERIADREVITNLPEILAAIRRILESSPTVVRTQMELDRRPGGRAYSCTCLTLVYAAKEILKARYDDVRSLLSDECCAAIGLPKKDGRYRIPRGSTICEFKQDILEPMLDDLTSEFASGIIGRASIVYKDGNYIVITIDSTPAQASRYNYDAQFNGHYMVRMDKLHIVMINGMPLFMIPTGGNTGDNEPVDVLFSMFEEHAARAGLDMNRLKVMGDGGYDQFSTFGSVFMHTGRVLNCNVKEGAVIHEEADWHRVQSAYTSMYRTPGYDPYRKNDRGFVLRFLHTHGKGEMVGKHLRNLEIERMREQESAGIKDTDREKCEVFHHSMKSWLDFTTVKIRHATRWATLKCRFLVAQMLSVVFRAYRGI